MWIQITKVNELTVLTRGGQVGAAMEGALCRTRDGYIRMHGRRHTHSSARLLLGSERKTHPPTPLRQMMRRLVRSAWKLQ